MRSSIRLGAAVALGLSVAAIACTPAPGGSVAPDAPAPADHADLALGAPAGTLAWRGLDALATARITLPAPTGANVVESSFPLPGPWVQESRTLGRLRVYAHPLPFLTDMPRPNYAPLGAKLYRGGTELPFVNDPEDLRGGGWFVEKGRIKVLALESPERWRDSARLDVPELGATIAARTWSGSGDAAAFVRTEVTAGAVTRPGIQIPAGGVVTFSVSIPADATLDFGVVRAPALLPGEGVGGARVTAFIGDDEIADARAASGELPVDEAVPLAKWAGTTVDLSFRADAGNPANVVVTAPTISAKTGRSPRHVIVVGIDTLRQDALGVYGHPGGTSPELDAWARQSVVFTAAWAPAPRTRPSFRTALTGRYPLAAQAAPTIAETLAPQGFRTAGVVANVHLVPRFGFNDGFEHWHYENGATAEQQVERALAWQSAHANEDTFLFLHLMDPHPFYAAPAPYGERFQKGPRPASVPEIFDRWHIYRLMEAPTFGAAEQAWIRAAYDGEVAYTSAILSRFFAAVESLPGRTVTAVHSDHGEEFWEHGAYEHNHSLYEELVRAVLWFRAPGGQSGAPTIDAPVGLQDLVPTLLDLVGARPSPTDGRSLAAFIDPARAAERPALADALRARPLVIGHLMFEKERWAVVYRGWKYILHTGSGQEEVYDLANDRGETTDLVDRAPPERLASLRAALAEASGWPVRPGWRLRFDGPRRPVELVFDAPIADAGIIDPEAERTTRANLEWGERPQVTVSEVGTVSVSPDRRTVRFLPGPRAQGRRIWVACADVCPAGTARIADGAEAPLTSGLVTLDSTTLETALGTLITVPAADEAIAAPASDEMMALEALGYVAPD